MITLCELGVTDGAHGPVNAGLVAVLRAAFPHEDVLFSDEDIAAAVAAYTGPPLPKCPAVVARFRTEMEALARSLRDDADTRDVVGIVQAAARFHALIEEAKRACA